MKQFDLERISCSLLHAGSILLFGVLTLSSLLFTRYFAEDYSSEIPYSTGSLFLLAVLGMAVLGAVILFLEKQVTKNPKKAERNLRFLLGSILVWTLVAGSVWVLLSASTAVSDQMMVSTSAERFTEGNYGRLDYGKYLYYYPFQLGLVAYEELVFRIFGVNNYVSLQIINVLGMTGSVYAGYCIVRYLFSELRVAVYYLLLAGFCFPLFVFCAYIYGDVLSISLSMFAIWQLLRYLKKGKKSSIVYMVIAMSEAVLLRSNSLIVLIAMACVLALKAIVQKRWQHIVCILLMVAGIFCSRQGLNQYYEAKSGLPVNDGMPSILWVAMGMQEGDKEAGWYNGYSIYIYQDVCLYHGPTAAELGKAEIKARAKEFLKDPVYALDFYYRKFSSQWAEPTYGCFIMTYAAENGRGVLGENLYTGELNRVLKGFIDSYQLLIYGMVLVYLWHTRKEKKGVESYILLIAIIGGVLFHLLWEAKSRYVLPYFVMMLPMAAAGLNQISRMLRKWRTKDETAETGR